MAIANILDNRYTHLHHLVNVFQQLVLKFGYAMNRCNS